MGQEQERENKFAVCFWIFTLTNSGFRNAELAVFDIKIIFKSLTGCNQ